MTARISALLLLRAIFTSSGASITAESTMIRRDGPHTRSTVQLGANGELISVNRKTVSQEATYIDSSLDDRTVPDGCDDDFPFGTEGSDECLFNSSSVQDDGKCREAAEAMNLTMKAAASGMITPGAPEEWERPNGCFHEPCAEDSKGCFVYNERDTPSNKTITGIPVCIRKKYKVGTATPGAAVTCPHGYEEIMKEEECRTAGICRGECEAEEFRTGTTNATDKLKYPYGCYMKNDDWSCVYFNEHSEAAGLPTEVGGTPICKSSVNPLTGLMSTAS
jgi:hypothetical protein